MRHGERADEVSGEERLSWKRTAAYLDGRYYDPPLTRTGHLQACEAGRYLSSMPFNAGHDRAVSSFERIYTSPLLRAVQTAFCISHEMGGIPLQVVPGLCACTAALVRIGIANVTLMEDEDIRDAFPDIKLLPRDPLAPKTFEGACSWIASQPRKRALAVGHREGTKGLAGRKVPTPHCCIGIFRAEGVERTGPRLFALQDLTTNVGLPLVLGTANRPRQEARPSVDVPSWLSHRMARGNGFLTGQSWLSKSSAGKVIARVRPGGHGSGGSLRGKKPARSTRVGLVNSAERRTGSEASQDGLILEAAAGVESSRCSTEWVDQEPHQHAVTETSNSKGKARAGQGFRATTMSRESKGRSAKTVGLLGLTHDALAGPGGVLSFLDPKELCAVRSVSDCTCRMNPLFLSCSRSNHGVHRKDLVVGAKRYYSNNPKIVGA